jgi:hypothetical protein
MGPPRAFFESPKASPQASPDCASRASPESPPRQSGWHQRRRAPRRNRGAGSTTRRRARPKRPPDTTGWSTALWLRPGSMARRPQPPEGLPRSVLRRRLSARQLAQMLAGSGSARQAHSARGRLPRQQAMLCIFAAPGARLCPNFRMSMQNPCVCQLLRRGRFGTSMLRARLF